MLTPVPAHATTAIDIASLLQKRVTAVVEHDENAFMATVDPTASDAFKAEQRNRYLGLQSLPLVDYKLASTEVDSGDLSSGLDLDDKYGTHTYMPETRESFRLGDYDDHAMRNTFWYTYVQRNGQWYFSALHDGDAIGLESTPNIWDDGALATESTEHFLVLTAIGQEARAKSIASIAERAMTQFQSEWTLPWSQKLPIIVPSSPEQAAKLLRTSDEVENFSAFTSYTPVRDNGWEASPPRLFAEEDNFANASAESQIGTIVHELTHAATAPFTGPNTPIWVQEGLAEWIRLDKPTSVSLRNGATTTLPSGVAFRTSDAAALSRAYNEATVAMAFLASTKGPDVPVQLVQEAGKRKVVIGSPSYNADAALKEATGWSTQEFLAAWGRANN